jgi:hypothetical protein
MRRIIVLFIIGISLMCVAAQQKKYTLGIGKYPGRVSENFSPLMVKDTIYRNIALNRAAYGSSSYDYNLTAQLVTDGKTITDEPFFISVSTPQGQLARREREWTIDGGEYSRNVLMGEDTYLQYDLQWRVHRSLATTSACSGNVPKTATVLPPPCTTNWAWLATRPWRHS